MAAWIAPISRAGVPVAVTPKPATERTELYVCDELLLCGTGAEITPVLEVDGRAVGSGKVGDSTAKLQDAFFAMTRGEVDRYAGWLVGVY